MGLLPMGPYLPFNFLMLKNQVLKAKSKTYVGFSSLAQLGYYNNKWVSRHAM